MSRAFPSPLSLRPATAGDTEFLAALYAETRAREMAATGWPEAVQAAFLRGQFEAQSSSYRQQYPAAAFDVVLARGKPVGRLYVARGPEGIDVIDVTLAAAHRSKGWGTRLLRDLLVEGDRAGRPVRLYVDTQNRARRLYGRLGFREVGREGFYLRMERPVGGGGAPAN